jgi:hypothetical protein
MYHYRYEKRLTTVVRSFALFFGSVVDKAVSGYVHHHALGQDFDILTAYEEAFDSELQQHQIKYPQHWDADVAREAGTIMVTTFPEVWDQSNLVAVIDKQGIPVVQRRIIAPLPQNHELELVIDVLVMDTLSGDTAVLDFKTTSQLLSPESPFGYNSFQLTTYQYGVDSEFSDYLGPVSNLGFQEFVKRKPSKTGKGKGPTVEAPRFYPRRSDEQVKDMVRTYLSRAKDIAEKRFHRPTNGAYNTPCEMCDFANLCVHNDSQGIIVRPARRAA